MSKIAIIGTAPHYTEAPYTDASWTIWGCSPANLGRLPRWDAWFQVHEMNWAEKCGEVDSRMRSFLQNDQGKPIYMTRREDRFPSSVELPVADLVAEFGELCFTSSIAWMLGFAIKQAPEAIGLWGVDMATASEYADQRYGCQFLMAQAKKRGIEVVLPKASLLNVRRRMYGVENESDAEIAIRHRIKMLEDSLLRERRNKEVTDRNVTVLEGTLLVLKDILRGNLGMTVQ